METQRLHKPVYSFEFFPPRTEAGVANLRETRTALAALKPRFFSVTFGAGGSTQDATLETALEIQKESGIQAAPHLSCIGSSKERIREILQLYMENGVEHIVTLRGDLPSGLGEPGEFHYANELVEFIREETGDHFHIEVAAYPEFHPQARSASADIDNFVRKVRSGANSAITQYFYNADAYIRFIESIEQRGLDIPVVPGIMPITNYKNLARFSDACGAEIPRWIRKRLVDFGNDLASIEAFGVDVVTALCQQLLDAGAPGLHFYTMNRASASTAIWKNLGL